MSCKPRRNKLQSLLVTLDSVESVQQILRKTRHLRQSTDHYIRTSIFINEDLSKVEAKVAYEERCRRRQDRQNREAKLSASKSTAIVTGPTSQTNGDYTSVKNSGIDAVQEFSIVTHHDLLLNHTPSPLLIKLVLHPSCRLSLPLTRLLWIFIARALYFLQPLA